MTSKKTVLNPIHLEAGARMVEFAGWNMPVLYQGVIEEHLNVRQNVGLFDVSHMGEIFFRGPKALEDLQWLTSNDVGLLNPGDAQYSLLLNKEGGLVDDIIVYCVDKNQNYLVCVNASNIEKDYQWMKENSLGSEIINESDRWSQIAIQGPKALELTSRVLGDEIRKIEPFKFRVNIYESRTWYVARTGYTGEDGLEVFLPNEDAVMFWKALMEAGADLKVSPVGLGARDTLRTEMKYSLYGNEITASTSALEAGLGWVIKFAKGEFIGKGALEGQRGKSKRRLVGFKMKDKGIPRQGYSLISFDNIEIGKVTSGTMSPCLKEAIGIGYVPTELAEIGKEFFVQIRDRVAKAYVVKTPFVSKL